ncbi:MAG: hypothetical protein QXT45_08165 [Candidatus Bilamarchaeaceae archaeon]
MALLWLVNTGDSEIYAMYGGEYYQLTPKTLCQAPEDAARHIASYYEVRGVKLCVTKEEAVKVLEESVASEEREEEDNQDGMEVVCDECGENFSEKKRPLQALKLHKVRQHGQTVDS